MFCSSMVVVICLFVGIECIGVVGCSMVSSDIVSVPIVWSQKVARLGFCLYRFSL